MEFLASIFVGKPQNILAVALLFLAGYLARRFVWPGIVGRPLPLLVASIAWVGYALWEWVIRILTPEANIRADLLIIWPVLASLSLWALVRSIR